MVENIASFEYIVTQSELEALVLECNLIKKYNPKYNIRLKDDKHYPYIKVDVQNAFPKVKVVRQMRKDGAKYFGPYTDASAMWELVEIIKKTWQLRSCSLNLPKDIGKTRACLNYHIGQCSAPCIGAINEADYAQMVQEVLHFLSGKYKETIKEIEGQMLAASEELQFEKAALLRDQIAAIKRIEQKQAVINSKMDDQDIIAFGKNEKDTLMQVYFVREGKMVGREHFLIEDTQDMPISEVFRNFVLQFYSQVNFIPKEILVEVVPEEIELLEKYLTDKKGNKVSLKLPQKGSKHGLLELASKNAYITLSQFGEHLKKQEEASRKALMQLKEMLSLQEEPIRIEAYDISNTQGVHSVGAMVVFEKGKPKPSDYRKFKIKTIQGANDYGSMEEVIERRISRMLEEEAQNSFSKKPDLILMDGGKGQVASAKKILEKYELTIPVAGMVKDDKHRTRDLIFDKEEVGLKTYKEALRMVTLIQDEVHRFAIDYHKKLRSKDQVQSILDDIKGIGKVRKKILLETFKGIEKIRNATLEELANTEGMTKESAQSVYDFFHTNQ